MESRQLGGPPPNNNNQAPLLLSVSGSVLLVAIILVSARLWSRLRPISNLKADDWTVLGATILALVHYLMLCTACFYGFGRPAAFVSAAKRLTTMRIVYIMQIVWYWSVTLVKLSVALLLLRIKPGRHWRLFLQGTMVLLVLTVIVQTCFHFLQCRPFSIFWDPSVAPRVKCIPVYVITVNIITNSTIHVALDLVFSFMPVTFIWKLQRPRSEKIFLSILMALGLFASAFAILRTLSLTDFYRQPDFFRMFVMPTLWATLEQELALVAAAIPTLKNVMQRVLVRIGQYFYEKESEAQVRRRLANMGFLPVSEAGESDVRVSRKPSKPEIEADAVATFGSQSSRKDTDEFGDTVAMVQESVEMVRMSAQGKDVGLARIGEDAARRKDYDV